MSSGLEGMLDHPAELGYPTSVEQERVRSDAQSLLTDLWPLFRPDGELANLAEEPEFDLESRVSISIPVRKRAPGAGRKRV